MWGLGAEPPAAKGNWILGRIPHMPEPGGRGAKPQPPEVRGLGEAYCLHAGKS